MYKDFYRVSKSREVKLKKKKINNNIFYSKKYADSRYVYSAQIFLTIKVFLNSHVSYSQREKNHMEMQVTWLTWQNNVRSLAAYTSPRPGASDIFYPPSFFPPPLRVVDYPPENTIHLAHKFCAYNARYEKAAPCLI